MLPESSLTNDTADDLCQLSVQSCQAICDNLQRRYIRNQIYTWCGASTLVAVNPCRPIPDLYTNVALDSCLTASKNQSILTSQPPHIYGIAAVAYHNLLVDCASQPSDHQTLIVSGFSGAGKTESSKHLLRFLSHASSSRCDKSANSQQSGIEAVIEAANPLLECFGNARTDENDNSSRFGRHLELKFDSRGRLLGGHISILLLERGRALRPWTSWASRDRPFHSLLALADADCRAGLNDNNLSERLSVALTDDADCSVAASPAHGWRQVAPLLDEFLTNGDSSALQPRQEVARLLAGILLLARLPINPSASDNDNDEHSQAEFPPEAVADAEAAACSGFGLAQADQLLASLTGARIQSGRGSVFLRACTVRECAGRRDAVCRLIYASLFAYLVKRINERIRVGSEATDRTVRSIGILDLYGFENFVGRNGLDQLLINYANERLQQFYLTHFVLAAKQEYASERLPWLGELDDDDSGVGNTECLTGGSPVELSIVTDAISQCERVLAALEELCRLNRPDRHLADRLQTGRQDAGFAISHYAGRVAYSVDKFPSQNRDRCPPELVSLLLSQTQSELLRRILLDQAESAEQSSSLSASGVVNSGAGVAGKFRQHLARLIDRLRSTRPLWIRCLRPSLGGGEGGDIGNATSSGWSDAAVASQLESCGLLPATRAARSQHPVRLTYADFLTRYGCLILTGRPTPAPTPQPITTLQQTASPSPVEFDLAYRRQNDLPTTPSRTPERRLRRRTGASPADHQRRLAASILLGLAGLPPVRFGRQFGRGRLFLTADQVAELDRQLANYRLRSVVKLQRAVRAWLNRCRRKRRQILVERRQQSSPPIQPSSPTPSTSTSDVACGGFISRHQLGRRFQRLSYNSRRQLFRGPTRAERLLPYARQRGLAATRGLEDALEDDLE